MGDDAQWPHEESTGGTKGRGTRRRCPWWGNPLLWLAVSAVFLGLGLLVAPHFLGGTVIFLPFLWIRLHESRHEAGRDHGHP